MKNSLKLLLLFISTFVFFSLCAGGEDFDEYGSQNSESLFAPEVIGKTDFEPFFKTSYSQYYGYGEIREGFYNQNINDWVAYFDNKVDSTDVIKLLYTSKLPQIDTLIFYLKDVKTPISKSLKSNSVLNYQNKGKSLEFLYYLGFALRCEIFANSSFENTWSYEAKSFKDNDLLIKLLKGGLRQALNSKEKFVKERYYFQLVRLRYFNEDYAGCEAFFEQNKAMFTEKSSMYFRSLGYVAASLYKRKQFGRSNIAYATIFSGCPQMRASAQWSFHPQEEADFRESLKLAKNNEEKTALYFLLGYADDEVRAINEILKIDPKSPYVPVLLTRAINEIENQVLQYNAEGFNFNYKANEDFLKLLENENRKAKEPYWRLALGYVYLLTNKPKNAETMFQKIEKSTNEPLLLKSVNLYRAISKLIYVESLTSDTENELFPAIQLIFENDPDEKYLRKIWAQYWVKNKFNSIYLKQKEGIKAECWVTNSAPDFYTNNQKIESLLDFLNKPSKTPYEAFISKRFGFSQTTLYDNIAVNLVFDKKLKEAIAVYEQHGLTNSDTLLGDPFLIHINDCHDCDHQAPQNKKYTNYSLVKELLKLSEQVEKESDSNKKAQLFFKIANAYYNITYFGNARYFYENESNYGVWSGVYFSYYDDESYQRYRRETSFKFFDTSLASNYYEEALKASNDTEFKAKCTFMLAKCEQNDFFLHKPKDYEGDFKSGKYFKSLKEEYNTTAYYKEAINECGYFATYINQMKK